MDKLVVLDFGGQYTHLIANRFRRMGYCCEIMPGTTEAEELKNYKGIILSGGPSSVLSDNAKLPDKAIFSLGVPVFGICYGHQVIAHLLGGVVKPGVISEYGETSVSFFKKRGIFADVRNQESVWMSHFDQVIKIPNGFEIIAKTDSCPVAGMIHAERNIFSVQFHPEVTHTECGDKLFENFVALTGAKKDWNVQDLVDDLIQDLKKKVGKKKVFLMVSGGVDSSVAYVLLSKALPQKNVYGLLVDTGFLRKNEAEEVKNAMKSVGLKNLHVYDAKKEYFSALKDVFDPEEKRQIIGDLFLAIQEKVSKELKLNPSDWLIGQGTIYPDTIESGESEHSEKIKTHHNRVLKVQKLIEEGKVIEPLVDFYKDEVRQIGIKLGIPKDLVDRHPFPGPGLAVRCLCANKKVYPKSKELIEKQINTFYADKNIRAIIPPIQSVGVQGDERTYKNPIILYGEKLAWSELSEIATRLINKYQPVNRVLYSVVPTEIESIDIRRASLTDERLRILRDADKVVMDFLKETDIYDDIWQLPTILVPLFLNRKDEETIILRPVCSKDAMTANYYRMSSTKLKELSRRLIDIEGVGAVLYDITNKPPGTIEWE